MKRKKVLYVEDEPFLSRIVMETLEFRGYEVKHVADGRMVLQEFQDFIPDICILDVMLPGIDGFSLGTSIRHSHPRLPIIFLTAKTQTEDVLKGFSSGGTDYLKKPFSMEELMVRMDAQLLMASDGISESGIKEERLISMGKLEFYPDRLELKGPSTTFKLSHRECEILRFLSARKNQISERKELLLAVWGDDSFFNSRNLDVYIRKIREYLTQDPEIEILTLKGTGYRFNVPFR
jgi:DNA-binding response OmpR family regulator